MFRFISGLVINLSRKSVNFPFGLSQSKPSVRRETLRQAQCERTTRFFIRKTESVVVRAQPIDGLKHGLARLADDLTTPQVGIGIKGG